VLHGKRLKYLLELYILVATIDSPTRTHMTATLIDNIFANLGNDHFEAANKEAGISCQTTNLRLSMPMSRAYVTQKQEHRRQTHKDTF